MSTFVSIFKTSIGSEQDKNHLLYLLSQMDDIIHCSLDLADDERILRICSNCIRTIQVGELMDSYDFEYELMDIFEHGVSMLRKQGSLKAAI